MTRRAISVARRHRLQEVFESQELAALNLGPKVIELAWTEKFAATLPDPDLRAIFQSQLAETRSHIQMGRFQVERKPPLRKTVERGLDVVR